MPVDAEKMKLVMKSTLCVLGCLAIVTLIVSGFRKQKSETLSEGDRVQPTVLSALPKDEHLSEKPHQPSLVVPPILSKTSAQNSALTDSIPTETQAGDLLTLPQTASEEAVRPIHEEPDCASEENPTQLLLEDVLLSGVPEFLQEHANIYFEDNSDALDPAAQQILLQHAEFLKSEAGSHFVLSTESYVDPVEQADSTQSLTKQQQDRADLSLARSESVYDFLIAHDVDPRQIEILSYEDEGVREQQEEGGQDLSSFEANRRVLLVYRSADPRV